MKIPPEQSNLEDYYEAQMREDLKLCKLQNHLINTGCCDYLTEVKNSCAW